jgi:hypothetical protein
MSRYNKYIIHLNVKIQEGKNRWQRQLRLCSSGLVQEKQETVHYEDNRYLQNGSKTNIIGSHGSAASQNHEISLCRYI